MLFPTLLLHACHACELAAMPDLSAIAIAPPLQAGAARLNVRSLQLKQEESRIQSRELREKRRQFLENERAVKEAEASLKCAYPPVA